MDDADKRLLSEFSEWLSCLLPEHYSTYVCYDQRKVFINTKQEGCITYISLEFIKSKDKDWYYLLDLIDTCILDRN